MLSRLLFSVIIPTYNRASYLEAAIDSALRQMIPGDEIIVVDDGSQDETLETLEKYGEKILVLHSAHCGAGFARNIGIREAQNDLVAFLDSDDVWLPGKLQLQRCFMEARPDILFSFTNFQVEHCDGSIQHRYLDLWHREHATYEAAFGLGSDYSTFSELPEGIPDFMVYEGDLYCLQLTGLYILTDTLVVRREEAGEALFFAEDLKTYEDLECFYRIARKGKGAFLDIETTRQLNHPQGRLSQMTSLEKIDAKLALFRRIWGADADFLARHGELYYKALDDLLKQKTGLLLVLGQNQAARFSLSEMTSPPFFLKMLAFLPSSMTLGGIQARRYIKKKMNVY